MFISTFVHTNGAYRLIQVYQELYRGRVWCQDCLKFPPEEVRWQWVKCIVLKPDSSSVNHLVSSLLMTNVKFLNHWGNWWLSVLGMCTGTALTPCYSSNVTWISSLYNNYNLHSTNFARESACLPVAISFQRDWFFNVNEIKRLSPCKYIHSLLWKLNVWQYLNINVFQAMLNTIFSCCLIGMCNLLPAEIMSYSQLDGYPSISLS